MSGVPSSFRGSNKIVVDKGIGNWGNWEINIQINRNGFMGELGKDIFIRFMEIPDSNWGLLRVKGIVYKGVGVAASFGSVIHHLQRRKG